MNRFPLFRAATFLLIASAPAALAQQFQLQPGLIPGTPRWSEGVAAADVENDGDYDLFFADGNGYDTPGAKQQNVLVINRLEVQPGLFADQSVARLGVSVSHAKMVISGDIQNDGLVDAVFCNAFYTDLPFLFVNQPGNPGFFQKEGVARGLTTSLSSASGQFGDLDNDGDLDLMLTDTGPAWLGAPGGRPRLYINNGLGFFTEDALKMNAALKIGHMGVQLVDIDNDFDLDFFGANRNFSGGKPHYLMLNDGSSSFADVSTLLPNTGGNVYEADVADLDGDSDLDIFFLSLSGFQEGYFRNRLIEDSALGFTASAPFGAHDDNEVSFLDFDNDGDLDVLLGSLQGPAEKLYRNDGNLALVQVAGAFTALVDPTLDVAVVDLNGDGAYDIVTSQGEGNQPQWANKVYANLGAPDTLPPVIVREEQLGSAPAAGPWIVRAHVTDQVLDDGISWVRGAAEYVVNAAPKAADLTIVDAALADAVVDVGTSVEFTNQTGLVIELAGTSPGFGLASGPLAPGASFTRAFVRPGVYTYTAGVFPGSEGVITVVGSTSAASTTYSGGGIHRFRFADIASGAGVELVYELSFADDPGNIAYSTPRRVDLTGACGFTLYGQGVSPVNDLVLVGSGSGAVGGLATLSVATSASGGFLALALAPAQLPLFGGVLLVDPSTTLGTPFVPAFAGVASTSFSIPAVPALAGVNLRFQAFAEDVTKPFGIALSNGVRLVVCP